MYYCINLFKIILFVKKGINPALSEGSLIVKNVVKFPEQERFYVGTLNTNLTGVEFELYSRMKRSIDPSLFYYISFNCKLITNLPFIF